MVWKDKRLDITLLDIVHVITRVGLSEYTYICIASRAAKDAYCLNTLAKNMHQDV